MKDCFEPLYIPSSKVVKYFCPHVAYKKKRPREASNLHKGPGTGWQHPPSMCWEEARCWAPGICLYRPWHWGLLSASASLTDCRGMERMVVTVTHVCS